MVVVEDQVVRRVGTRRRSANSAARYAAGISANPMPAALNTTDYPSHQPTDVHDPSWQIARRGLVLRAVRHTPVAGGVPTSRMLSHNSSLPFQILTVTKWPCRTRPTVAAVRKFGRQSARSSAPSPVGLAASTTGTVNRHGRPTSRSRCFPPVSRYSTPASAPTESEKMS